MKKLFIFFAFAMLFGAVSCTADTVAEIPQTQAPDIGGQGGNPPPPPGP